jgi:hypothetical protein
MDLRASSATAARAGDNRASAFDLDDEQRGILDHADRFARNELYDLSLRMDAEEWWPADAFRSIGANGFLASRSPSNMVERAWIFFPRGSCCKALPVGTMP